LNETLEANVGSMVNVAADAAAPVLPMLVVAVMFAESVTVVAPILWWIEGPVPPTNEPDTAVRVSVVL
jgi:hypothetical protein